MTPSGPDDTDRLRNAIEAYEGFIANNSSRSVSDFLAEHAELRDLLEPLIQRAGSSAKAATEDARILGDFRLLGELGRGGMGIVYDAEQISLGRRVAVKVLPKLQALDSGKRARFAREARLAASLDHPGIAKVISADDNEDVVWFAMELIDGSSLDRILARSSKTKVTQMTGGLLEAFVAEIMQPNSAEAPAVLLLSESSDTRAAHPESTVWHTSYVDTIVRIGAQLATALHHAHLHGVVHRDVKPANVLLRRDGTAVLTDFGLACDLNEPSLTVTGDFLGTPSYCSPEQLEGDRNEVDHHSDIFSLGVTLYELLAHRRPFEASSSQELRHRILTDEPPSLRRLNPKVPADLVSVLAKALQKSPEDRYQTASAMSDDLRAIVAGEPVCARPIRLHTRTVRWCRRNPWVTASLFSLLAIVLLLIDNVNTSARNLVSQRIQLAWKLMQGGQFKEAEQMLSEPAPQFPARRTAALHALYTRFPCMASHQLTRNPNSIYSCTFSDNGKWFVTVHEESPTPKGPAMSLHIWRTPSPNSPDVKPVWGTDPVVNLGTYLPLGTQPMAAWATKDRVFVGGPDRELVEIEAKAAKFIPTGRDGRFGVELKSEVQLWSYDGQVHKRWPKLDHTIGQRIVDDLLVVIRQWERTGWSLAHAMAGSDTYITEEISKAGGRSIPYLDADPNDPTRILVVTEERSTCFRSRDGELLATGSIPHKSGAPLRRRILVGGSLKLAPELDRFADLPNSELSHGRLFPASGDGRQPYVVAVDDSTLRILESPQPFQPPSGISHLIQARWAPSNHGIAAVGKQGLSTIPFEPSNPVHQPPVILRFTDSIGDYPRYCGVVVNDDDSILATVADNSSSGRIIVMDARGNAIGPAYACTADPWWTELSPNGRHLAVALQTGSVDLWQHDPTDHTLSGHRVLRGCEEDALRLSCVRFLDDNFLLGSMGLGGKETRLLCWNLKKPNAWPTAIGPSELPSLRCLSISQDDHSTSKGRGRLVATGGDDGNLRILLVVNKNGEPTLNQVWQKPHRTPVFAVAFAKPDATPILASATAYGGIRLWNATSGAEMGILRSGSDTEVIIALEATSDGNHLLATAEDGSLLVFDIGRAQDCIETTQKSVDQKSKGR